MREIRSESKFIWNFILQIILTPFTIVLVLFKKKRGEDLVKPFKDLLAFVFEPKVTITLIILNTICFILEILFQKTALNLINHPSDMFTSHAYTLLTSGFLHASIWHLLGNMLALFIFGRVVERRLGPVKMLLIYFGALLLSGIFSSLIHTFILHDNTGGLGASGAIMGLVSTAILADPFYITYELILPLPIMVVGWLTIAADIAGILNPVEDGIGHLAHLGGFLSIALLLYFLGVEERKKIRKGFLINVLSLIIIAGVFFFFVRG